MKKEKLKTDEELKKETDQAREELRQWLVKHTKCEIQSGMDKAGKVHESGWPCGTCTCDLLARLGAVEHITTTHNQPVDRNNEMWRGILQIRGEDA